MFTPALFVFLSPFVLKSRSSGGMRADSGAYGAEHRRIRRDVARRVDLGVERCVRCGGWIAAGAPWDLDHTDDRTGYLGPAHRRCNRGAGAVKGNKSPLRRRPVSSEAW